MGFFSLSPEELEFATGHGVEGKENEMRFRPEQWFGADEGLAAIRGLEKPRALKKIKHLDKILADLDEFERVLGMAKEHGVGWHLAVDY